MRDIWLIGPSALAFALRRRGFTTRTAVRLADVLRRVQNGEFPALGPKDIVRLLFACWLVDRGRLTEHAVSSEPPAAHADPAGATSVHASAVAAAGGGMGAAA